MFKKLLLGLVLFLAVQLVNAQSFDNLKVLVVEHYSAKFTIRYNPAVTKIINKKEIDKTTDDECILAIETSISGNASEKTQIRASMAPSDDPHFSIGPEFEWLNGEELIIPGNGYVYTAGRGNEMFDVHRKFLYQNGKFVEVKQPFYYVGMSTETVKAVALYSDTDYKSVVASLPAGYKVEVVINKGEHYLVKTPGGLVGWVKIPEGSMSDTSPLKGIYYLGD